MELQEASLKVAKPRQELSITSPHLNQLQVRQLDKSVELHDVTETSAMEEQQIMRRVRWYKN